MAVSACVVPTETGLFIFAKQVVPAVSVEFAVQNDDVEPEMPTAHEAVTVMVVVTRADAPAEIKLEVTLVVVVVVNPPVFSVTIPVSATQYTSPPPFAPASVIAS